MERVSFDSLICSHLFPKIERKEFHFLDISIEAKKGVEELQRKLEIKSTNAHRGDTSLHAGVGIQITDSRNADKMTENVYVN
jgi:hypothetical protein